MKASSSSPLSQPALLAAPSLSLLFVLNKLTLFELLYLEVFLIFLKFVIEG